MYKLGDIVIGKAGSMIKEGRIVGKHIDGPWIIEVVEAADDCYKRGDLCLKLEHILDAYYTKASTFFQIGKTYKYKGLGSTTRRIVDLHEVGGDLYATAVGKDRKGQEFMELLVKGNFDTMEEVQ